MQQEREDLGIAALRMRTEDRIALMRAYVRPAQHDLGPPAVLIESKDLVQGDNASDHRARARITSAIRTARLAAARRHGTHTDQQWLSILCEVGCRCVWCGRRDVPLAKDHIRPLYLHGSDGADNLQPLCVRCNSIKAWDAIAWIDYRRDYGFALDRMAA